MSASSLFIMDLRGRVILSRDYRGDLPLSHADNFARILAMERTDPLPPIIYDGEVLNEESIHDNFVITYELLDEMMDYGVPQTTDSQILKTFILVTESYKFFDDRGTQPLKHTITQALTQKVARSADIHYTKNEVYLDIIEKLNINIAASGQIVSSEIQGTLRLQTRLSGMPELKLGLNDRISVETRAKTRQQGQQGQGRQQQQQQQRGTSSSGSTNTNTNNNSSSANGGILLEDVRFHQCVELGQFDNNRVISFVPPDGEIDLMTYRLSAPVKPLITAEAHVEAHPGSRILYLIKLRSHYKKRSTATDIQLMIPVPHEADSPLFSLTAGHCQYVPEKDAVIWTIKQLAGQRETLLRIQLGLSPSLSSSSRHDPLLPGPITGATTSGASSSSSIPLSTEAYLAARPPMRLQFELPYFTISGIQVRYLKVTERSRYEASSWVRYITQSGDYQIKF